MKVIGGCGLDNNITMKDFEFEDGTSEEEIQKVIDEWARSLFRSWYVICKEEDNEREEFFYGE